MGCNEGWRERRDTRDWDVMKGGGKGGDTRDWDVMKGRGKGGTQEIGM